MIDRKVIANVAQTYAPFWLQVAYVLLLLLVKEEGAVWAVPGDVCFAGGAFVVWGLTTHMNAGKRIAGGGRYASTPEAKRTEFWLCLVVGIFSLAGVGTGYRTGAVQAVAWAAMLPILVLSTWMLAPENAK